MFKHIAAFQEMILHGNDDAHSDDSGSVSSPTVGNMTLFSLHHLLTAHEPWLSIGLHAWTDGRPLPLLWSRPLQNDDEASLRFFGPFPLKQIWIWSLYQTVRWGSETYVREVTVVISDGFRLPSNFFLRSSLGKKSSFRKELFCPKRTPGWRGFF